MQDIDRPAHIEAFPQPSRARRPRMQMKALPVVLRSKDLDRVTRHGHGWWGLGQEPAIRPTEPKRAVRLSIDAIALLVERTVMPATQQREVRERGGAAFGPVTHVMPFTQLESTAREAAPAVSVVQRAA
jgi:hypothetical protein